MDLAFCENIIIKFLFINEELRDRTLPYIVPEIFDDYNNIAIVRVIKNFHAKFDVFPSMNEMKLELPTEDCYKKLLDIFNINLDDYSHKYLLDECEEFIKLKVTKNNFFECSTLIKERKFEEAKVYPDKIRESLAFSFDTKLGLDFLEDEERIYNFLHGRDTVVPYGIGFFDRNTKGGAHEKSVTLILAESNLGKTLIMSSLAANNIRSNKKVLYVTCEMAENKISERALANIWDSDINELDRINRDIFHSRYVEMKKAITGNLQIKEYAPRAINCNDIRTLIKEYEIKKKFKPDIIYLDYIELINPIYSRKSDNSYTEGKRKVEEFRAVAVEYEIPLISAIQTNRQGMGASDLDMTNTADSIGYIYTADVVFAVTQPEQFREQNRFSVNILKNRYGFNKVKGAISVDVSRMRIGNVHGEEDENLETLRRPAGRTADPTIPNIAQAINIVNDGFNQARNAANESVFGDWE